jgi:glycosyltransferase involved in cell wall biosynthesis
VVASDVGDVARIVVDGETGLVVPPKAPEQLAAALRKVVEDAETARRMGRAGRARAEQVYSSAATARAIGALYDQLRPGGQR